MKVALTGHRPQRLGMPDDELDDKWDEIGNWIRNNLIQMLQTTLLEDDSLDVYCGMATGSDILFGTSSAFLKAADIVPLKLHCVLPCKDYNSSHKFYKGCDNVRDQYLVDHCDVLLAVWDGIKSGGVWSTIRKAQKAGKTIVYCPVVYKNRE